MGWNADILLLNESRLLQWGCISHPHLTHGCDVCGGDRSHTSRKDWLTIGIPRSNEGWHCHNSLRNLRSHLNRVRLYLCRHSMHPRLHWNTKLHTSRTNDWYPSHALVPHCTGDNLSATIDRSYPHLDILHSNLQWDS